LLFYFRILFWGLGMTFAEKLRELREAKGWSQKELADRSETTQQAVGRWEAGDRVPSFQAVLIICKALGVRCTTFDGCEFLKIADRGRGRPPKPGSAESKPAPTAGKKPRKRKVSPKVHDLAEDAGL
jgi:transcriptional regulator with XRE-family HTH domain